jgi:hypothetical protein
MVQIKTSTNSETVVGVCYKRQATDTNEIQEIFKAISEASQKTVLIMGDFNFPSKIGNK